MTSKTISDAITNISAEYIEKAADYTVVKKAHKPVWLKWAAMAACLCLVVTAGIIVPKLINSTQDDIIPPFVADAAPMVYVNNMLYKQSTTQTSYAELKEEFMYLGEIESEVINDQSITDGIPNKNFQANHSIVGSKVYQYGDDIVVEINGKYWLYEPLEDSKNENVEFHGKVFNKADLSAETIEWLGWYNTLTPEEQLSISYVPHELYSYDSSGVSETIADE